MEKELGHHGSSREKSLRALAKFISEHEGEVVSGREIQSVLGKATEQTAYLFRFKQKRVAGYHLKMNDKVREWL